VRDLNSPLLYPTKDKMAAKKHILIVDDNSDILDSMRFVLEEADYTVTVSEKGDTVEGLLLTKESLPKLLILDLLLSGKDGSTLCSLLKSYPKTRNLPIIMISAHADGKKLAVDAGADDFLAKPFDINNLLKIVKKNT
jgi:DNA-binding response OmpR family regulator